MKKMHIHIYPGEVANLGNSLQGHIWHVSKLTARNHKMTISNIFGMTNKHSYNYVQAIVSQFQDTVEKW